MLQNITLELLYHYITNTKTYYLIIYFKYQLSHFKCEKGSI